jgi:hypothetical protein
VVRGSCGAVENRTLYAGGMQPREPRRFRVALIVETYLDQAMHTDRWGAVPLHLFDETYVRAVEAYLKALGRGAMPESEKTELPGVDAVAIETDVVAENGEAAIEAVREPLEHRSRVRSVSDSYY